MGSPAAKAAGASASQAVHCAAKADHVFRKLVLESIPVRSSTRPAHPGELRGPSATNAAEKAEAKQRLASAAASAVQGHWAEGEELEEVVEER